MPSYVHLLVSSRLADRPPVDLERRASRRTPYSLGVDLHGVILRRFATADVSRGGMLVVMRDPPPVRHAVVLTLALDDGPLTVVATVVRHVRGPTGDRVGMGLK